MADVFDKQTRSRVMRQVRGRDTKPELFVRRWLHREGFRFRLHRADLPGKPDIVLPRYGAVILVHGCFWHGHPGCPRSALPTSNRVYWETKISRNIERDQRNQRRLRRLGWRVITLWECRLKDEGSLEKRLRRFLADGTKLDKPLTKSVHG